MAQSRFAVLGKNNLVINIVTADPDYAAQQGWIPASDDAKLCSTWDGKQFLPPPALAPIVPDKVPMASARIALLRNGITTDKVEAAIAGMADEQARAEALIAWEYRTEIHRAAPLVAALAPALGLTDQQLDDLFRQAESI